MAEHKLKIDLVCPFHLFLPCVLVICISAVPLTPPPAPVVLCALSVFDQRYSHAVRLCQKH